MAAVAPPPATPAASTPAAPPAAPPPAAAPAVAAPPAASSLYVGDLDREVTEAQLYELFSTVGPVASIRVCRDAVTRRSLGYAYVNYNSAMDETAAERALEQLNYTRVNDKPIRIMWSHRDPAARRNNLGNIFIKNLEASIDNKALHDTFETFGKIISAKVATDASGNSRGYGFVHYETEEAAKKAIDTVNGMLLEGKKVFVGPFVKKDQRASDGAIKFTNVYVKNFPPEWTDAQLQKMFEKHGEVANIAVMRGEDGNSKGFGFVSFASPEAASAMVEAINGSELEGRVLFAGRAMKKNEREAHLKEKFDALREERIQKYQGMNLYVKNLDDSVDDEKLREEFAAFGTVTSAKCMRDDKGSSKNFGFVCYSTPEEATKAVTEMNGKMIGGKPVYVALAQRKEVRKAHLEQQYMQRLAMRGAAGPGMPPGPMPYPPAAPLMYAPGVVPPGAPRPGMLYPMMPGPRGFRGAMPGRGIPGFAQMPGYVMGPMPGQPRGGRGGRGGKQPAPVPAGVPTGVPGSAPLPKAPLPGAAAAQARPAQAPRPPAGAPAPLPGQPVPVMVPGVVPGVVQADNQLTTATLAAMPMEQQKQMLGERLFPLVQRLQPDLAGKITGMLLEMDNAELLLLLESPEALADKVNEAIAVLKQHSVIDG